MKNMEKETKIKKSAEGGFHKKRYQIERAQLPENEPIQCEKCTKEDDFRFHDEGWFIEGEFYCGKHKEEILDILEAVDKDMEKRKLEQERIVEERRK